MKRILSLLIAAVMLLLLPADILAVSVSGAQNEPTRVRQLEELRESNSDTYLLSDGSYECVVYADDKYFKDDSGKYVEIDHSIIKAQNTRSGRSYAYKNAAGDAIAYFAENEPRVCVEINSSSLSFYLSGANRTAAKAGEAAAKRNVHEYELFGKNYISYENVLNETDLIYEMLNGCLKEYVLLKDRSAPSEYTFIFDTSELAARKTENDTVEFINASNETVFELGALFAVDSNGEYTDALEYTVRETGKKGRYEITVSISEDYLTAPERAFRVLVDPSVMVTGEDKTYDSYVSSEKPDKNFYLEQYLRTGRGESYGIRRSYIMFSLPYSVKNRAINSAYFRVRKSSGDTPTVNCYPVKDTWTSKSIKWSNMPNYYSANIPYIGEIGGASLVYDSNSWYKANITSLVQVWVVDRLPNYGIVMKDKQESNTSHWTTFYSSDAASPSKPELIINYSVFEHSIKAYYDKGYYVYYRETSADSKNKINSYISTLTTRYSTLLGVNLKNNGVVYYRSPIDRCKEASPYEDVTIHNIDKLCSHTGQSHTTHDAVGNSFINAHPGSTSLTTSYWTAHKLYGGWGFGDNRSFSWYNSIFILRREEASLRDTYSLGVLMHEMNHQFGAPDHYHEVDKVTGKCKSKDICSTCGSNKRPATCIMNQSRQAINGNNIMCPGCKYDIFEHLKKNK